MKFRDFFSLPQILFAVFIIALTLLFAFMQTGKVVEVFFLENQVEVSSDKYSLTIPYDMIASAELSVLPDELGEEIKECTDDDILVAGNWKNDAWGEYYICAYDATSNCVVVHLNDGRIFVFSSKDDATTKAYYEELLKHLN